MASGDKRHGKELAADEGDKFPEGLRVLAVDDDLVCLRILGILLHLCKYNATMVTSAAAALNMLREGGEDQFDLVITDVHMPDMDGFELLEVIGLEMDLPVIMLSVDGEKDTINKGLLHGACDYLVKPVDINQLRNIWRHVERKTQGAVNHSSSDESDDPDQRVVQPVIAEREHGGAKNKKSSKKKKKNDGDNSDENRGSTRVQTTWKKPRVSWSGELHKRFIGVINQLGGVNKAFPKTILKMMNIENLTRASVASHLQKYRLYLKRVSKEAKKSNYVGGSSRRRRPFCYMDMDQLGGFSQGTTLNNLYAPPSMLQPHGLSIQPRSWAMGPPAGSFPRVSDHTRLGTFPPSNSDRAYGSVLREKLMEANSMVPTSHPGNSSFADMPNDGLTEHLNQFPVQHPELIRQSSGPMYVAPPAVGARRDAQFPYLVGTSSNPWQNVASSSFHGPMDGAPSLPSSQVNIPQMNQLPTFGASSGQMLMFQNEQQNQMTGIINSNTSVAGRFSEQVNISQNNQLPSFAALSGQMSMFQNEHQNHMTGIINGNTSVAGRFNEQVNIPQNNQLPSFPALPGQMPMFQNEHQNQMTGIINGNTSVAGRFNEQVNIPQNNQLPSFAALPGQMPMFQNEQHNQMEGILNNNTSVAGRFNEQVNIPQNNQLAALPGQMPMFQNEQHNQMQGILNNNTSMGVFSEPMTPLFDIASNTAPAEMNHGNFSPMTQMMVNGGSTSSLLPNFQTGSSVTPPSRMVNGGRINSALPDLQDSSVVPTQVFNGGDVSGILPVHDDPADQQAPDDQPTFSDSNMVEEIFASMVNQGLYPDDAFFGGEY